MTWKIWCQVSGGVTGYRAAWLKNGNGEEASFATREEAEREAAELTATANGGAYRTASFYYTARQVHINDERNSHVAPPLREIVNSFSQPVPSDPLDVLVREYVKWNAEQGLTLGSADEHLFDEGLTHAQRTYLRDFCRRWEAVA